MKKRILSLLLTFVMLWAILPATDLTAKADNTLNINIHFENGGPYTVNVSPAYNIGQLKSDIRTKFNKSKDDIVLSVGENVLNDGGTVADYINTSGQTIKATLAHNHDSYTAWNGATATGTYYLSENKNLSSALTVPSGNNVTICLHGKTLNMGSYPIENKGTLTICDCTGTGKIVWNNASVPVIKTVGGNFIIENVIVDGQGVKSYTNEYSRSQPAFDLSGNLTLKGTTTVQKFNLATPDSSTGFVTEDIICINLGGTLNLEGNAKITGCSAKKSVIAAAMGDVRLKGGTITGCSLADNNAAIVVGYAGHVSFEGTKIEGNNLNSNQYAFYMDSNGTPWLRIFGGTLKNENGIAVGAVTAESDQIYIWNNPVIEGIPADIYLGDNISVTATEDDEPSNEYFGRELTIKTGGADREIVKNVTTNNMNLFKLADGKELTPTTDSKGNIVLVNHTHIWGENWDKNDTYHWKTCSVTGCKFTDYTYVQNKNSYGEHGYGAWSDWTDNGDGTRSKTASCVCGSTIKSTEPIPTPEPTPVPTPTPVPQPPAPHQHYDLFVGHSTTQHWQTCGECLADINVGEHVYDNASDMVCNVCNRSRANDPKPATPAPVATPQPTAEPTQEPAPTATPQATTPELTPPADDSANGTGGLTSGNILIIAGVGLGTFLLLLFILFRKKNKDE